MTTRDTLERLAAEFVAESASERAVAQTYNMELFARAFFDGRANALMQAAARLRSAAAAKGKE